jgi:lipoyl(octanoyl) transferase
MTRSDPLGKTQMSETPSGGVQRPLSVWLAGRIGLDAYWAMAERLAWEVSEPSGRPPTLVLYELDPVITIGRLGSRTDVDLTDDELRSRRLEIRFVGRGGGAVLHGPGQVGIALFAKLEDLGFGRYDVGSYLERFETGLEGAVRALRCGAARDSRAHGIFGRTGLLAAVGIAVRRGVVRHGGFLNVQPALELFHRVQTVPVAAAAGMRTMQAAMSSVEADVQRKVRLQDARSALVQHLVDVFGFPQSHIQSGFPVPIRDTGPSHPEFVSRVG